MAEKYNMTTEEVMIGMFPTYSRKEEKQSSKCLVYTLGVFVAILFVWLVFASIVLHVGDPQIQLKSARLTHNTKKRSVNVTIIARVSLTNPNMFGRFYYDNSTVTVLYLYGASSKTLVVGVSELEAATLEARETKQIDFMLNMVKGNLTNNIIHSSSGMLKLRSYAKLSGTVHVLKVLKKKKTIDMACIFNLNFSSYSTQHFQC